MRTYLVLVLLAPVIETYIKYVETKKFLELLAIFLFLDVYLGYFWKSDIYYHHGYDILNFITLYLIGAWIRCGGLKCLDNIRCRNIVVIGVTLSVLVFQYKLWGWIDYAVITDYCSPVNIVLAACIFYLFLQLNVKDSMAKPIIFMSASAVSVYLITDHPSIRHILVNIYTAVMNEHGDNAIIQLCFTAVFIVIVFTMCCCIDKIRIHVSDSLLKYICKG